MDFFAFLAPIEWAVAWIMYLCHQGLTYIGFSDGPGPAWVLSIVGLVIIIRILLIPLFFKQIKASRGMQLLQPEMQAIQKKYKGKTDPASREAMSRETMELYRKHGTNPFASCLPLLLQSPIFFALFRVLNGLVPISEGRDEPIGPIDASVASDIESSTVFGAQLSDIFLQTDDLQSRIVIAVLIVAMSATTFFTQRQLTMKNMPKAALEGPMAQTQKMMLYLFPFIFAVSGVNFPVGVLVYWTTTNLWSMGQQFYTIRRMPAPGSEAERLLKERQARKKAAKGIVEETTTPEIEQPRGQRQQPKRKDRQKGQRPPQASNGASAANPSPSPVEDAPVEDVPTDAPPTGTGTPKKPKKKP
jgi:YidC/Oxa1 family membrane protein insertase